MKTWSNWKPFPSPENCRNIEVIEGLALYDGPGVYQIRNKKTGEYILFGIGIRLQERMQSLMPKPYGKGSRNNEYKRQYILDNYQDLQYRTFHTDTREEAADIERAIKQKNNHRFNT
jgi:hypothetical protein